MPALSTGISWKTALGSGVSRKPRPNTLRTHTHYLQDKA